MKLTATACLLILFFSCTMRMPNYAESGFIQMGSSKIYYERNGVPGNNVILLHAGFLDLNMWKQQVSELSKHFTVTTIDLPGHGKTENDTIRYLPADFIKTVMDSLHIQKASVVGVSFGASCATDFAIAHPESVNKLILVAPGINGWDKKFTLDSLMYRYINSFFGSIDKKDSVGAAGIFTQSWFDGPYRTPQQVNDSARRYVYETTLWNIRHHKVRGWPTFAEPPAIENISKIKVPTLIIHGDKDMPFIDSTTAYLEKHIQNSKRIMIPGTGHMLNMEAPIQFNKIVIEFLSKKQD